MERATPFAWTLLFAVALAPACSDAEDAAANNGTDEGAGDGGRDGVLRDGATADASQSTAASDGASGDGAIGDGAISDGAISDGATADANQDASAADASQDASTADGGADSSTSPTSPTIGGCDVFPPNDAWNVDVSASSIDTTWTTKLVANATLKKIHPDFGSTFGIPINVVPMTQPLLTMSFSVPDESDIGPYPFPGATAKIEGGTPTACTGDCHVLTIKQGTCELFEAGACHFDSGTSTWSCYSGAKWDLSKLQEGARPAGFTSADAAGLSITAGLVRYDEVAAGEIRHAIRFTMHCTQDGYVTPASHQAVPSQCPNGIDQATLRAEYPPMGTRIRLKATFDTSAFSPQAKVVATAMKKYGLILADNGSDYFFQGEPNAGFNDNQLDDLKTISGDQFEVLTMPTIQH